MPGDGHLRSTCACQCLDFELCHVADFQSAVLAFAFELDRHAGYSQDLADVRGQTRRVPATLARKNREQPVPLFFGGACVKVQRGFLLDFMHSARRIDGQRNIQPRQIGGAVLAGIDMPADHHRAVALGW